MNDVLERRYQYDVLDRLTGISDSHWGEQTFRLNGAGQVTAERRDEGRLRLAMKRETRPGFRPKDTHFDWDVQDRLVRVSLPDGARWRYRYDAFGRRVSKVREGQAPSALAVARVAYRWDGDQLIGQQQYYADGSAAREVQWVYEPGSFRPLAQAEAQGDSTQLHYIVTDLTGTARELCSEEGEIRWRGEQGLWGAHREERRPIPLRRYLGDAANEEVYCELRYQGQLYDAETGLYYNRHRYYDAESGQYLSPDPIGLLGGRRPQGYVHNPLEWVDPLGLAVSACKPDHGAGKSTKKYGHSRSTHGSQNTSESMKDRARSTGKPQGHYSDNRMIEEAFEKAPSMPGVHEVTVSKPSMVYYPDGSSKSTNVVKVIISERKGPVTSYPYVPGD